MTIITAYACVQADFFLCIKKKLRKGWETFSCDPCEIYRFEITSGSQLSENMFQ